MGRASVRVLRNLYVLVSCALVVAALYFARSVFIPVTLSVLLTFLLSPLMLLLQRRGASRALAAASVVVVALMVLVFVMTVITHQIQLVTNDLPHHKQAIIARVDDLRDRASNSWLAGISDTLTDISKHIANTNQENTPTEPPTRVTIVPSHLSFVSSTLTPWPTPSLGLAWY